ncbi:hypothetical protein FACS189426_18590 [Bacteroidia bacterium]|nr:hypothetical protein FACS189426_18590 [Bacteroidia bacterium]
MTYNNSLLNFNVKVVLILFVHFLSTTLSVYSQKVITEEDGKSYFQIVDANDRYVSDLLSALSNDEEVYNLPLGSKKIIGASSYSLVVSDIKIGAQYGEATMFLKIENLYKSRELIFGATGVKISYNGDLAGDINLSLLSDIPIRLGNMGDVILKGSIPGNTTSGTRLTLDCNGDFQELMLDGELILNKNTFKPAAAKDENSEVRAAFRTSIFDLTDFLFELSVPDFEIKGIPDFVFSLSNVALDLSDIQNPSGFMPDEAYFTTKFTLPDRNLWRGLYAENISVTFPSMFDKKGGGEKSTLSASHFLIDENGITGDILGTDILSFEAGDAGGCSFSVTDFYLTFFANNISKFGFAGDINIPMSETTTPRHYEAFISKDEYLFNVSLGEAVDFSLFGAGKINLQPTSYMQIGVANGKFVPKVVLDGDMTLAIDGLSIEQLAFHKLCLSTQKPIFSVESVQCGGNLSLNNFPISISNFSFSSQEDLAVLGFELKINLMEGVISAGSAIKLKTEYRGNKWTPQGLQIEKMTLDNVKLGGFSLSGEIHNVKNDPVYGDYLGGDITAVFSALSNGLSVNVKAVFGKTTFRYWYVEGQANFSGGIPIGVVTLNGFTGGAYYRMSPARGTGIKAYAPDERYSLGVKAGVSFHIASKAAVSGNALFEMNFLSTGGVGSIMFYGSANFLDPAALLGDKFKTMFNQVMEKTSDLGESLAAKIPGNKDGSEVAESILPNMDLSGAMAASLSMKYDFVSKTFDANFRLMVNIGGILRGSGAGNQAGWVNLHCSPQTWYIHAGTPSNPVGLALGLGSFSLKTESYFMLGDKLEKPILDPNVARILKITPQEADYMKFPESASLGKGVAFGSRFSFNTGNLSFLMLYANFKAGMGFDVMLSDMSNFRCEGSNSPVGINGWYANGQTYAYLEGKLGVRIKILTVKKDITVISGSAATLLQARLPNPTWVGGYMAVDLNVLGIIKANMKMKFSFGDDCKLVNIDGNASPVDFPLIADLTPAANEKDVDVFLSPQATFNMGLEEAFDAQDDDGNTKTYRIRLADFYITDNKGQKMAGNIKRNKNTVATFESSEILPPNANMKATVSVSFEENVNNNWQQVTQNGKVVTETRTVDFTTGGAPNYIPLTNIEYCYPVIDQKNFFIGESSNGFVQLKKGQSYLFPTNFDYKTSFGINGAKSAETNFNYNVSEKRLTYTIPNLKNRNDYEMSFVAYAKSNTPQGGNQVRQTSTTVKDGEGEAFTIDYMQQAAQKITKDGSMKVLNYTFRSSGYNTFEQKMSALAFNKGAIYVNSDVIVLNLGVNGKYELFDEIELVGSPYNNGKPLVVAEAILDDSYYIKDIAPVTYDLLSVKGMSIQNREPVILGAPPVKAFYIRDGYLSGNETATKTFPLVYQLPYYYNNDYYELRNKAANLFDKGVNMEPLIPLITGQYPVIKKGDYKTQLKYVLPEGKQGTTKQINYIW